MPPPPGSGIFLSQLRRRHSEIRASSDHLKLYGLLSEHGGEWEGIITAPSFQEYFTVNGSALKNVPAGYEKEHPQAEYLKYKSWYLEYPIQDEELADGELFLSKASDAFRRMKPFNDYLNRALAGFQMAERQPRSGPLRTP